MRFDDEEFFEANTININRLVTKILILLNLLPPVFIILNKIHIFITAARDTPETVNIKVY